MEVARQRSCCARLRDPHGARVDIATYRAVGGREETCLENTRLVLTRAGFVLEICFTDWLRPL